MSADANLDRSQFTLAAVAGLALCFAFALFPGDASFIHDEPLLVYMALRANQFHVIPSWSLSGSTGVVYGAFPVWLYQLCLFISYDLRVAVVIRALLVTGGLAVGLLWLARTLRLAPWFALATMLTPYLWYFSRHLWSSSLCIPFTALALAAYASFLRRPGSTKLSLVVLSCFALILIHLMSVALIIPIALHMLVARRDELLRRWKSLGLTLLIGLLAAHRYFLAVFKYQSDVPSHAGVDGWWFPLMGARVLGAAHISSIFGTQWLPTNDMARIPMQLAQALTTVAYPLSWLGMFLAARTVVSVMRQRRIISTRDHVSVLCLGILLAQVLLDGISQTYGHAAYYCGTWIAYVVFAWLGLDWLVAKLRAMRFVVPAYVAAQLVVTIWVAYFIHVNRGMRSGYGPCLAEQMKAVAQLNRLGCHGPFAFVDASDMQFGKDLINPDARTVPVESDVPNILYFPHAMNLLQELHSAGSAESNGRCAAIFASTDPDRADLQVLRR